MPKVSPRRLRIFLAAVSIAGLVCMMVIVYRGSRLVPCSKDFAAFYAGGRLSFSDHLYSRVAERDIYSTVVGCPEYPLPYVRPAYHAALFKPLAVLPYQTALGIWYVLTATFCILFAILWKPEPLFSLVLVAWSYPLTTGFIIAQDLPILLFSIGGAAWAWRLNRPYLSATCLLLGSCKPHLLVFFVVWIIIHRPRRFTSALALGSLLLLGLSFWTAGPRWIEAWLSSAADPHANSAVEWMISFKGIESVLRLPPWFSLVACAALVMSAVVVFRRLDFVSALYLSPVVSLLISPHSYLYDTVCCIPLLIHTLQEDTPEWLKAVAFAIALPITHAIPVYPPLRILDQVLIPVLAFGLLWHFGRMSRLTPRAVTP
jgi:hypothetical protein